MESNQQSTPPRRLSRRNFIKASLLLTTGAGVAAATSCAPTPPATPAPASESAAEGLNAKYLNVPPAPTTIPPPDTYNFFTFDQINTLNALVGRIIPGDANDPGAREAGVVQFIDQMLATSPAWPEPTYTQGPFAKTYKGATPPPDEPNVIWVNEDQIERYGFQSKLSLPEIYRTGIQGINHYAQMKYGKLFADLSEQDQDNIITAMSDGNIEKKDFAGENGVEPKTFFNIIQTNTYDGMFCDPVYGGNHNMVGWQLVGYPGAHRAYTPEDMLNENFAVPPQDLLNLPPFHVGQHVTQGVILPAASDFNIRRESENPSALEKFLNFCRLSSP